MSYDHQKFSEIVEHILSTAWRYPDELVIGENISDYFEMKVIFNKFGFNDETGEDDNETVEEYCVFIHLQSGVKGFKFPEHDSSPFGLIHRPKEEVCVHAWFLKNLARTEQEIEDGENEGTWEVEDLEDTNQEIELEMIMDVLTNFDKNYSIT
jgi:hypothetical protein